MGQKLLTEPGYVLEKHLFEQWLMDEAGKLGSELSWPQGQFYGKNLQ